MDALEDAYLRDIARTLRRYKSLGELAIAQVRDQDLTTLVDPDANSIAIVVKHIAGNFRSRFTDFLTTDGEKPTRNRDEEFELRADVPRDELLRLWESGWSVVLNAIDALAPADLLQTVRIRGEAFLVLEALNRATAHVAYHVGQIVVLAKHFAGPRWTSLSIPKGRSAQYSTGTYKQGIGPNR